jgi:hypothetical protein
MASSARHPTQHAERFSGVDGRVALPVASPRCGKVLLVGEGRADAAWPVLCRPASVPSYCTAPRALCYANRSEDGTYQFVTPSSEPVALMVMPR